MSNLEDDSGGIKLSHKQRKALQKKLKRKACRQEAAKLRDEQVLKEEERRKQSPGYQANFAQQEYQRQVELVQIEAESRRQHELWVWAEERWAEQQKLKKEQEERDRLQKLEIEKKIKEEWEERQKKEQEEEEEKRKKKEKQAALLQQARDAENKDGDWHNPLAPPGRERETCPFFAKVGACRFGERCSRGHPYPESSTVLMLSGMFSHFRLDQGLCEEYDTDIVLEYEDSELYQSFKEFFEDVLPEFKNYGEVVQFKVCCNYQSHLRGNVYIQFAREENAMKAFAKFNGRWYGGKQLSCEFVTIPSWRAAICGLFGKGRCPKGKECNFLHVFTNPNNEFWQADKGFQKPAHSWRNDRPDKYHRYRRSRSRSRDRDRNHSKSASRSRYSRQRHSRSRSRSRDKYYKKSKYKRSKYSRSRSRSKSRSYSRAISYSRSRSRSKESCYKRNFKRDYSKSVSRSRSRSFSRSRSKSIELYKDNRKRQKSNKHSPESVSYSDKSDKSEDSQNKNYRSYSRSRSNSVERKSHKKHKKNKHKKKKDKYK